MTSIVLRHVVFDCADPRALAEFYRELLGFPYRPGDEAPPADADDPRGCDWLVLRNPDGGVGIAFQASADLPRATWPDGPVPQQAHLDCEVTDMVALAGTYRRALELGASLLRDCSTDAEEPLYVLADPAGHPFCIFVEL
jgi:catechol 2,3-dioxygenase-like lactoylglutathione lyase family enzyme